MAAVATFRPLDKENAQPSLTFTEIDALSTSLRSSATSINRTSSSTSRKKPTLGVLGIGRAPKNTYRKHSAKPYGRVTSVQRAKKAANKLKSKTKGIKAKLLPTVDKATEELIAEREKITRQLRHDRWQKSLWNPSPTMKGKKFSIPYKLPLPTFPPIPPVDQGGLRDKPIQYLSQLLSKHLPNIEHLTLAHRPHINVASLSPKLREHSTQLAERQISIPIPERIALAIPEVVQGNEEEKIESILFKPDVCLVIMARDDPLPQKMDGKILVPAMSMVLATQCAYWQELSQKSASLVPKLQFPLSDRSATPVGSPALFAKDVDEVDADVTLTAEQIGLKDVDSSFNSDSHSDTTASSQFEDGERLPPSMIFAKVVPIVLPSPKTYEIVHQHLHHPERSLLHDLLSIPQTLKTRGEVIGAIEGRSVQECMDRLEMLQGVWQNLCALGKVGGKTWDHLGGAWAYILGVITGHGILVRGAAKPAPQGPSRTFAEWVAREWVTRAKAVDARLIAQALKAKRAQQQARKGIEEEADDQEST